MRLEGLIGSPIANLGSVKERFEDVPDPGRLPNRNRYIGESGITDPSVTDILRMDRVANWIRANRS